SECINCFTRARTSSRPLSGAESFATIAGTPSDWLRPAICLTTSRAASRSVGVSCATQGPAKTRAINTPADFFCMRLPPHGKRCARSEEHTSELQSLAYLVCRLLLEKKKNKK